MWIERVISCSPANIRSPLHQTTAVKSIYIEKEEGEERVNPYSLLRRPSSEQQVPPAPLAALIILLIVIALELYLPLAI